MKEQIKEFLLTHLDFLPPEVIVIIISAMPILELRGGVPLALGMGFPFWKTLSLSLLGNFLPILPLLYLFRPLSNLFYRFRFYRKFYKWLYGRTIRKSENVKKFGAIGLILFTAIPLPTTGAYTACIAASLFDIPIRYSLPAVFAGVIIAGLGISLTLYFIY